MAKDASGSATILVAYEDDAGRDACAPGEASIFAKKVEHAAGLFINGLVASFYVFWLSGCPAFSLFL
jgi:hypothetical protein